VLTIWWLSYVDEAKDVSRGVAIVRAGSFLEAVARARQLGISPGGQVNGIATPSGKEAVLEAYEGKLLSPDEARALVEASS
jgi:hypothetical protein